MQSYVRYAAHTWNIERQHQKNLVRWRRPVDFWRFSFFFFSPYSISLITAPPSSPRSDATLLNFGPKLLPTATRYGSLGQLADDDDGVRPVLGVCRCGDGIRSTFHFELRLAAGEGKELIECNDANIHDKCSFPLFRDHSATELAQHI